MKSTLALISLLLLVSCTDSDKSKIEEAVSPSKKTMPMLTNYESISNNDFLQKAYDNQAILDDLKVGMQVIETEDLTGQLESNNTIIECKYESIKTTTIIAEDVQNISTHNSYIINLNENQNDYCDFYKDKPSEIITEKRYEYQVDSLSELLDTFDSILINKGFYNGSEVYELSIAKKLNGERYNFRTIMRLDVPSFFSNLSTTTIINGKVDSTSFYKSNGTVNLSSLDLEGFDNCNEDNDGYEVCVK